LKIYILSFFLLLTSWHVYSEDIVFSEKDSAIFFSEKSFNSIAQEMQSYIFESTGIRIPVSDVRKENKKTISLVKLPDKYHLKKDGFIISSPSADELKVEGKNLSAISFGVYDLLENNLGIKWLFPHEKNIGTYIPHRDSLTLKREERKEEPAFINRTFSSGKISGHRFYRDWIKKMRVVGSDISFHHNLHNLFPPLQYIKSNPEFYPTERNGTKYPLSRDIGTGSTEEYNSWQPVLDAKGVVEEGKNNIVRYFQKNPAVSSYSLGMNDSINWGYQQLLNKRINSLGYIDMSDYYFLWVNQLVSGVLKSFPEKKFGLLAYHNLADAPSFNVNHAVIPFLTYDGMQWLDNARKLSNKKRLAEWSKKAGVLGIYDYIYGDEAPSYSVPRIYLDTMAEYYQFSYENNVRHYYAEAYPSTSWIEGPKLYITSKLLWNPYIDIKKELDDWYKACVGAKAAPYLAQYYQFWDDFWSSRVIKSRWFKDSKGDYLPLNNDSYLDLLTKNDLVLLENLIKKTLENTSDHMQRDRAQFIYNGWTMVKENAFGHAFIFRQGKVPSGYKKVFEDNFERDEFFPSGWTFWNRPDTGAVLHEKAITSEGSGGENRSLKISVTPNGKLDGYVTIHKEFNGMTSKKYCFRVKTKSNLSSLISFGYKNNKGKLSTVNNVYSINSGWNNSVGCMTIPSNEMSSSIYLFLSIKGKKNKLYETFFDDVEIFEEAITNNL